MMSDKKNFQKCTIRPAVTFCVFSFLFLVFFVGKVHMGDSLISGLFDEWGHIGRVYVLLFENPAFPEWIQNGGGTPPPISKVNARIPFLSVSA